MADASTAPQAVRAAPGTPHAPSDRVLRFFERIPLPPAWVGVGISLAYYALFLIYRAFFGAFAGAEVPTEWGDNVPLWEGVNAVLLGYLLAIGVISVQRARSDLDSLRPYLELEPDEAAAVVDGATRVPGPALWVASLAGVAMGTSLVLFDPGIWGHSDAPPPVTSPVFLWVLLRNILMGWSGLRAVAIEIVLTRGYWRVSKALSVDLLDPRCVAPFARKGQRSLVILAVFLMLFSLFFLGESPAESNPFLVATVFALLPAVFLVPLLGARGRIVAAKQAELGRVNERIRRALAGGIGDATGSRLADWVAYRELVDGVREWPVSAPTLLRSLLIASLAVGSWLGGALVERLLGAFLD